MSRPPAAEVSLAAIASNLARLVDLLTAGTHPAVVVRRRQRREFGAVRQLPSGRFQASYVAGGTRHLAPETFTTRTKAERWLRDR